MDKGFIKDCLLFGSKEPVNIKLGIATWTAIILLLATPIVITILICRL